MLGIDLFHTREVFTHEDGQEKMSTSIPLLKEKIMSQPGTFQAVNNRHSSRIGQFLFTFLAVVACALGSLLLSLAWFGVGVTPGLEAEARGMAVIIVWPVTMLVVWICSSVASLLGEAPGSGLLLFPSGTCYHDGCLRARGILHGHVLCGGVHGGAHAAQHRCDLACRSVSEKHIQVNGSHWRWRCS